MSSKLTLYIHSNKGSFCLDINNDSETSFQRYIELISIFWTVENGQITLTPILKMNSKLREHYNKFVDLYKSKTPVLNRLKSSLDKINDDEYFFTSNKTDYTTDQVLFIGILIDSHNNSTSDEETAVEFENLMGNLEASFGKLLENYELTVFDSTQKIKIGESDRNKRICRFCSNGMNTEIKVTFKHKAHAFSDALGNKSVVLNDECDTCNNKFGSTIEEDFIRYLDIYRAFSKDNGGSSTPKLKFENGAIQDVDGLTTVISQDIDHDEKTGVLTILLKSTHKLVNVNIYKALCKYALSVVAEEELIYLTKTIDWIKSEEEEDISLPKVAVAISNNMYVSVPVLGLYMRKNDSNKYPHIVGEFKYKSLIFVFLIPFSSKDKTTFTTTKDYNIFWKLFDHYSSLQSWKFHDLSIFSKEKFQFKIQLLNKKT